jgi:myo-inositol-1(or 4)-monophosphatase
VIVPFDILLDTAHKIANAASKITMSYFRNSGAADHKGGSSFDPVTAADREAEIAARAILGREFPDHGILGEEFGRSNAGSSYVWTLDPIDGTRAFILGFPMWGTLIGLQHEGKPILGIMDQPFTGERFWNDERAAWYRGPRGLVRCTTRRCAGIGEAHLTATTPDMFDGSDETRFNRLASAVRMRRFGGDCYAYCMLALGQIDIIAEAKLKPFDIVPLYPIIEKAGGVVTNWEGGSVLDGGRCVACGDPALHGEALKLLSH